MPRPGGSTRNTRRVVTNRVRATEERANNETNRQETIENVSTRRRNTRRVATNRARTAEGGACNAPNRQRTNGNVSMRRRRRNNRRTTNRQRASEGGTRSEPNCADTEDCNTQQSAFVEEQYDFEALYWGTKTELQFQSMKYVSCLIIGLFLISNILPNVSPGIVDGLQAVLIGFLYTALHFEQNTHLKGRRNEKYNRYFFQNLLISCGGTFLMIQKMKTLEEDVFTWKQSRIVYTFVGGFLGTELLKENELMGGIMGAFTGLMAVDVFLKPNEM